MTAMLIVILSACTGDQLSHNMGKNNGAGKYIVYGTLDSDDNITKVNFAKNGDVFDILWEGGDDISLFSDGQKTPEKFELFDGGGTTRGSFVGNRLGTKNFAKAPYCSDDWAEGNIIHTCFPQTQYYYSPETFDRAVFMMAAEESGSGSFLFSNLCAVLKVSITGKYPLKSVSIIANDSSAFLCGDAEVAFSGESPHLRIVKTAQSGISNATVLYQDRVILDCHDVQLDEYEATDFFIVLPPVDLRGGFKIEVKSKFGSIQKETFADISLNPSTLYSVPCFNFDVMGGLSPSSALDGYGTKESPFHISSVQDLLALQVAVNGKSTIVSAVDGAEVDAATAYYVLDNDLDLSEVCGEKIGDWIPIGVVSSSSEYDYGFWSLPKEENPFKGSFDGNGHKISNLYVNDEEAHYFGLFGVVSGVVKNLEVEGNILGGYNSSLLSSVVDGSIINCSSRGKIFAKSGAGLVAYGYNGFIDKCTNYADISFISDKFDGYALAGGIMMDGNSRIKNCVNYGNIIDFHSVGGISGKMSSSARFGTSDSFGGIINSANYGTIRGARCGGIISEKFGTIVANCVNYGEINACLDPNDIAWPFPIAGGIANENTSFGSDSSKILNCIAAGSIILEKDGKAGSICGFTTGVEQSCFWLKGCGADKPSFNKTGGLSSSLFALDSKQMKEGAHTGSVLYEKEDKGYDILLDALNAWAFDNRTAEDDFCGWTYSEDNPYPTLTFESPTYPGDPPYTLLVSVKTINLSHKRSQFSIDVKSISSLSVSCPEWISVISSSYEIVGEYYSYRYVFESTDNDTEIDRDGEVVFTDLDNLIARVVVSQPYVYCSTDYSREGNVVRYQSASEGNGIDVVFMGDGYSDRQVASGKYHDDMVRGIEAFFSEEPYTSFRHLFNIYYVETVSENEVFGMNYSTALGGYFGEGTLVGGNNSRCMELAKKATGKDDVRDILIAVIMNTYRYNGTCYWYSDYTNDFGSCSCVSYTALGTAASGQCSFEATLVHETGGHAFAKLVDEYSYDYMGTVTSIVAEEAVFQRKNYGIGKNVDFTPDPFSVCWSTFLTDSRYDNEGLGVYEGAYTYAKGAYRPTRESIMNHNTGHFNAPSREAIYYRIHKLAYGDDWQYNYEDFVEYDAVNRKGNTKAIEIASPVPVDFKPLHPPVIIRN